MPMYTRTVPSSAVGKSTGRIPVQKNIKMRLENPRLSLNGPNDESNGIRDDLTTH